MECLDFQQATRPILQGGLPRSCVRFQDVGCHVRVCGLKLSVPLGGGRRRERVAKERRERREGGHGESSVRGRKDHGVFGSGRDRRIFWWIEQDGPNPPGVFGRDWSDQSRPKTPGGFKTAASKNSWWITASKNSWWAERISKGADLPNKDLKRRAKFSRSPPQRGPPRSEVPPAVGRTHILAQGNLLEG